MYLFSNLQITKSGFLSFLLSLIPLSFVAGNMIININLILLIIFTFILFGKNMFRIKYYFLDYLIFAFFFLILLTGIINDIYFYSIKLAWKGYFATIIKSFFFFKYLLLYLVIRFLIEREIIQLKLFFVSCALVSLFVSFDIFYQFYMGKDIFGFVAQYKLSGPFGDELIAGGFLQRFSIFSFFVVPFFYSKKLLKYTKYLIPILFIIFIVSMILAGNRMPLLLFVFTTFLIFIFHNQTKKYFIPFIFIFVLSSFLIFKFNPNVKESYNSFYLQISKITSHIINKDLDNKKAPQYLKEFVTFYDTWLMHKYIGGGIKNFRYYCHHRKNSDHNWFIKNNNIDKNSTFVCNMHPHNYYLEILTETGLIGFIIISSIFITTIYLTFYKKYISRAPVRFNNIIIPFIFLFIAEIFPLKSTGSFFTTGNTTYLFLIMAILIALARKDISIENKI